jgi:O-glycosyl hydrolase
MKLISFCSGLLLLVSGSATEIKSWLTQSDNSGNAIHLLEEQPPIFSSVFSVKDSEKISIDISSSSKLQTIEGFGAGLPQGSAYVLYNLKQKNPDLYQTTLQKLFTKDNNGMNMNILRFPIGSCDFSITNTTYDEVYWDWDLSEFSIDKDSEMIVEVLLDVGKVNPDLVVIGKIRAFFYCLISFSRCFSLLLLFSSFTVVTSIMVKNLADTNCLF